MGVSLTSLPCLSNYKFTSKKNIYCAFQKGLDSKPQDIFLVLVKLEIY